LKLALAMDSKLLGTVLRDFVKAVFRLQRRVARRLGVDDPKPGAVAFVQWFTGDLRLHPHFHVLLADGVFHGGGNTFAPLPPPSDEDVAKLLRRVALKTLARCAARFPDGLPHAEDAFAHLAAQSIQTRLPLDEDARPPRQGRRCAFLQGFSLHADTHTHANDRKSLERLCAYGARGPIALSRLSRNDDGRLEYRLKRPRGGASVLVMTPAQLLKRLCPLVVRPKLHLTRFFGVFAPHSKARADVVPQPAPCPPPSAPPTPVEGTLDFANVLLPAPTPPPPPRLNWAALLRRTFDFDVFDCPCGGRRRVLAFIDSPALARKILGLPATSPPRAQAQPQAPPQLPLQVL
jgi:hypothetical protein